MAKNNSIKPQREPGQFKQLLRLWKLTAEQDKKAVPMALAAGAGAFLVALVIGLILGSGNGLILGSWITLGVVGGVLTAMIVLSRKAEAVAYGRIEGQPGAVGAVLGTIVKRGWSGSDTPVAVSPKSQDLLYRISGRAGIVLIAEGHRVGVSRLVEEEKRKLAKVTSGVPIHVVWVCNDEHSTKLAKIRVEVNRFKRTLNRSELSEVNKRLSTLKLNVPMPKGIDPNRMRMQRR